MNSISPAASLDDPFYYLANFRFVLEWVEERHGDLLDTAERDFLAGFAGLPKAAQALLVRMVMRKGEHFRVSRLVYAEIGDAEAALAPLAAAGFVEMAPRLSLDTLFAQLRLAELRRALADRIAAAGLPAALGKAALFGALTSSPAAPRPLTAWWPEARDRVVRLAVMETCDRLRLMFFGNLRQGWEEFVLTELGLQRFEAVPLTPESRAFRRREELEAYLALQRLRERLEAGEAAAALVDALPGMPDDNGWLRARRHRLVVELGRRAEREGEPALARRLYASAGWPVASGSAEARVRHLRLLERLDEHGEAHGLIQARLAAEPAPGEAEGQALARLLPRLGRRLGLAVEAPAPAPARAAELFELTLPRRVGVELAVRDHLQRDDAPVHYVENALFAGLFGLLCWEALFAPLPGAFFHPFQAAPADLGREDFVARRRERFDACLARLDDGTHREAILATWRAKHGLASPFVHWEALDEALLTRALACIPPHHLRACCERLLADPLVNRAGLPDLIQFLPGAPAGEPRYRLIEVKGPGDRLQDNQRRWLAFFQAQGIPAAVCRVRWRDAPA